MPDPIDYPWAVVTINRSGIEGHVHLVLDETEATVDRDVLRRFGHESHVVPLHDLLAWVRANAREGRT